MANVLLAVTGSISAYKAVYLLRLYAKNGHAVRVIMTSAATKFVSPLTFETLSGHPVYLDDFESGDPLSHINLGKWADIIVIAPASANTIAKIASGFADNLLSSTVLASVKPLIVCPAMNGNMYLNQSTQNNINILKKRNVHFIDPSEGMLACGDVSSGKLEEPDIIYDRSLRVLNESSIKGIKVLITAGPTIENIDPVRYISNYSSGKMGYAIAKQADYAGADVILVSGPSCLQAPVKKTLSVKSADEMYESVRDNIVDRDIIIMSAAVADYKPERSSLQKIKKEDHMTLKLVKNIDILKTMSLSKRDGQVFVGFAAESENIEKNAIKKLKEKKLDMIVANDISRSDIGFGAENNEVIIYLASGEVVKLNKQPKENIAIYVLELAAKIWKEHQK